MGIKEKTASSAYGDFKSVLLDNKKEIIKMYNEFYSSVTRPLTGAISNVMVKSSIGSMISSLLEILASSSGLSVAETIIAVIKWGLLGFTVLTASGIIGIEFKNYLKARKDYKELLNVAEQMSEHLDDMAIDLFISIKTNGNIIERDNYNVTSGVYTFWTDENNIVQIEMDAFICRVFDLEEQLLSRGYPGCQEDVMALQRLVRDYAVAKPDFKSVDGKIDPKESLFMETLKAIETKIQIKLDSHYGYTVLQDEEEISFSK